MENESDNMERAGESSWMTRRRFLGIGAIATCGVFSYLIIRKNRSTEVTLEDLEVLEVIPESFTKKTSNGLFYNTKPVEGVPQSWVDAKGKDVLRYANYIQDLGLKNITPYDVIYPHLKVREGVSNSLPPRDMWKNIVPTLRVIDSMATHMKTKIKPFVSIYRSPRYTRAIRGRSKSQHLINQAVDIQFHGVEPAIVAKVARRFREAGHFSGGVGDHKSYTHIDTRGENVDW